MMHFEIPDVPPSLNQFIGRQNVWEYRTEKQKWKQMCIWFCKPRPKKPVEYGIVKLSFVFPTQAKHDADNYQKMILDGLVSAGIIIDDDFNHIKTICQGRYEKGKSKVEIDIFDLKKS